MSSTDADENYLLQPGYSSLPTYTATSTLPPLRSSSPSPSSSAPPSQGTNPVRAVEPTTTEAFPIGIVAGIVVAAGFLCVLIVVGGLLWLRRHRARKDTLDGEGEWSGEDVEGGIGNEGAEKPTATVGSGSLTITGSGTAGAGASVNSAGLSAGILPVAAAAATPASRAPSRLAALFQRKTPAPPDNSIPAVIPPPLPADSSAILLAKAQEISHLLTIYSRTFFLLPTATPGSSAANSASPYSPAPPTEEEAREIYKSVWSRASGESWAIIQRTAPVEPERMMCTEERWLVVKACIAEYLLRAEAALEFWDEEVRERLRGKAWKPRDRIAYIHSTRDLFHSNLPQITSLCAASLDRLTSPLSPLPPSAMNAHSRLNSLTQLITTIAEFSFLRLTQPAQYMFFWDLPAPHLGKNVMALKRSFNGVYMEAVEGVRGRKEERGIVRAVVMPGLKKLGDERGRGLDKVEVVGRMHVLMK